MTVAVRARLPLALVLGVSTAALAHPRIPSIRDSAADRYVQQAEAGDTRAQKTLGFLLLENETGVPDPWSGVRWLSRVASQPDTEAQVALADFFREGRNVRPNPQQAVHWYGEAASRSPYAAWRLGQLYELGDGVPSDSAMAFQLYARAAAAGFAEAHNSLGNLYLAGIGGPEDYHMARRWYAKAAAGGSPDALLNMAGLYYFGLGVKRDYRRAYSLAKSAADRHARDAAAFLSEIERKKAETGRPAR
jgi:TPR repeat protein